jgi:hypothetical protein
MPESLAQLEGQRADLLAQFPDLGDFRPGSITTTSGKCGKPSCRCAQSPQAVHGPNFRLTRKAHGKTVTETFPTAAALRQAQREVAQFHRFQELCRELVLVSEQICRLRPVAEEEISPEEKKRRKRSARKSGAR